MILAGLGRLQVPFGDEAVLEQSLGSSQLATSFLLVHSRHLKIGLGALELGFAIDLIGLRVLHRGLRGRQGGGGAVPLGFEVGRVDDGQRLSFLDHAVEVGMQFLDPSRNLATHLHGDDRLQRSGRGNGPADVPALHRHFQVLLGRIVVPTTPDQVKDGDQDHQSNDRENQITLQSHEPLPFQDASPPSDQPKQRWPPAGGFNIFVRLIR